MVGIIFYSTIILLSSYPYIQNTTQDGKILINTLLLSDTNLPLYGQVWELTLTSVHC